MHSHPYSCTHTHLHIHTHTDINSHTHTHTHTTLTHTHTHILDIVSAREISAFLCVEMAMCLKILEAQLEKFYLIRINFRAYLFSRTLAARNLKIFARIYFRAPWILIIFARIYFRAPLPKKMNIKSSNFENLYFKNFRADLFSRTSLLRVIIV